MDEISTAYLTAAEHARSLLADDAVRDRWESPSALEKMSVGALACHLATQVLNARSLVAAGPSEQEPIALVEHYARAAWVGSAIDDKVNVGIREEAEESAADGVEALLAKVDEALAELRDRLTEADRPAVLLIPWQGWSLTLEDFLVTRMMEIVVHSDDLAVSVDVPTLDLPDEVLAPVLGLLTSLSVRRHGQVAVVRALSRAERAPKDITAF
jgi:hypothetical protein